ncbi:MAG TPA: hypothetical protein ENK57_09985 [Polyangiaceae bacterium]|nr:hypothetical protein [Polyangiaceae bacterium]
MVKTKVKRLVDKVLADAQRLNSEDGWDDTVEELAKMSRSPKWKTVQHAPVVWRLGEYLTRRATLLLFQGSPEGWPVFVEGLEHLYWRLRISQSASVSAAVSTYVNLLLTGQAARADWLLRKMVADAQAPGGPGFRWVWSPFSQLVAKLGAQLGHCDELKLDEETASEFVSPFTDVLEAWPDAAATAEALSRVCTHHVRFARSADEHDFQRPLYTQICPLEVHLVNHYRRHAGLEEVVVEHELLDTPFGKPPPVGIEVPELCKPVADLLRRAHDEGLIDLDKEEVNLR